MAIMNGSTEYLLNIIRAAIPYVTSRTRSNMEVAIKTGELAESFQGRGNSPELEACDLGEETVDVEGLLLSVQNVCVGREREMVNTALNFYKTRSLYQAYQAFRRNTLQPELQAASVGNEQGHSNNPNNTMFDFLMSQLTPEQKSTFDTMNMLINNGNFSDPSNLSNLAKMMGAGSNNGNGNVK
ncbi:hypothetical protein [[Clostridium] polysaccharolyticum]|jgi:hypothetical protein|uniref:Uncharacterized protein n=1 Tax=[Clostridium] polysaccharolyticum TaxID=29364 RepID=A0A1H9YNM3_9FIRM|nr:hypothetical protein [[Clostridium] polysaccharolyticum]SES70723.1 hypothetical protein SAMN04487772_102125 [[Clostridium] polysaccharolyticum]